MGKKCEMRKKNENRDMQVHTTANHTSAALWRLRTRLKKRYIQFGREFLALEFINHALFLGAVLLVSNEHDLDFVDAAVLDLFAPILCDEEGETKKAGGKPLQKLSGV